MTKEDLKQLILDQGLTALSFIEAYIEINSFTGIGLAAFGNMLKDNCLSRIRRKEARTITNRYNDGKWTLTDPATLQYGKQISPNTFAFKERDRKELTIDIHSFNFGEIESTINSYGYTLLESDKDKRNIAEIYGTEAPWIIAECLFEMQAN